MHDILHRLANVTYNDNVGILMLLFFILVHLASWAHLGSYISADIHARATKLGNHNTLDETFLTTYYKLGCNDVNAFHYYGIVRTRPSRPICTQVYIYDDETVSFSMQ